MSLRLRCLIPLLAIVIVPVFAGAAEGTFERTLKVTGPVDLDVQTGSGNITVRAGLAGTVQVHGLIRVGMFEFHGDEKLRTLQQNPPIEQTGNVIRIGRIADESLRRNVSISYEVTVPAETKLQSHTGSGRIELDGVRGPASAHSGSGSVKVSNIGSEVRVQTGSGHVELDNIQGEVHAETGSGSIRSTRIGGGFEGHTGSGSVQLAQTAPGNVRVRTGSGRVELENVKGSLRVSTGSGGITAQGEPAGRWDVETGSGNVHVRLPSQAAFEVHARTSSGSISTDHPVTVQGSYNKHELNGMVRGGGNFLDVRTSSGDIRIE
jgi:DUF4097 and DUF4098 domain-containing protein YvlB